MKNALLVLEDGSQFYGKSIGADGESVGEIVFNTSMTGYQEIITDPSYANQIVVLTCPHVGNVGINELDNESDHIHIKGLVIRNSTIITSSFRCILSLSDYLIQHNVVGIADIDTRKLTRLIRRKGIQIAYLVVHEKPNVILAFSKIRNFFRLCKLKLAYQVSTSEQYIWNQGTDLYWNMKFNKSTPFPAINLPYHVVIYDLGIKRNIMRILVDYGCKLTVVPAKTAVQEVIDLCPDGIFISNGPGDPNEYIDIINVIQYLLLNTNIPIFGICLGHQLLALAAGAKTIKMKFGHHGSNHPVKDLETNRVMITTQNHNFVVDKSTLPDLLEITHISLFDGTIQGIRYLNKPAFGFQGHPEASPGPHDSISIFGNFLELIKKYHSTK